MRSSIACAALLALSLSACAERAVDDVSQPADPADSGSALESDPAAPPAFEAGPGEAPAGDAHAPTAAAGVIGFEGFGPAAFGADQEQVRMAWGRDLGDAQPSEAGGCYYLIPQPLGADGYRIAFMMEGDRFARIDIRDPGYVAPGGGAVGMDRAAIEGLYRGRIEAAPHKYVDGAQTLRVAEGEAALVFETDAAGRVTAWRIGVPPQVDYVEGCS